MFLNCFPIHFNTYLFHKTRVRASMNKLFANPDFLAYFLDIENE